MSSRGPLLDLRDQILAEAAVEFARAGWRIFPCIGTSKRPRWRGYLDRATSDPEVAARWWSSHPVDNIAAVIPVGLVVVDLDRHGDDQMKHTRFTPENFPSTLTTETGTGWHLWYRMTPSTNLRSTSDSASWRGVEIKRRAVTVPPSMHGNGSRYRWRLAPVAPLPGPIAQAFIRSSVTPTVFSPSNGIYIAAARRGVCADLVASAGPGHHHEPLVRAAFRYRALGLSIEEALADLVPRVPGHDEREARRTVASVWR